MGIVNRCFKQSLGGSRDDCDSSITACGTRLGESKHQPGPCSQRINEKQVLGSVLDGEGVLGMLPRFSPCKI